MTIYAKFREQVRSGADKRAVFDEERSLTRSELDSLANTIASKLPEGAKRVGVVMEHGVEMIAAIFAVLKTGAAYIPAEPDFPVERIKFMMRDCRADCIITQKKFEEQLDGFQLLFIEKGLAIDNSLPDVANVGQDLAYILYTSGTTGKPKGVSVTNENVLHYVRAFQNEFHPNDKDIMLQYSVCSFDIFVEEVFTTILSGATLAIPSAETKGNMNDLMSFVEENRVTEISGFPYLLAEMNTHEKLPQSLRLLISGGDVLRAAYITNLIDKVDIYNTYGPSETTVCASYFRCNGTKPLADGTYPIGKAVSGTEIRILDENLQPVAVGEKGEICILGGGVSNGYVGEREAENRAFVTLAGGERLYKSGDMGYLLPDGNIAFLHRKDMQIMILGKRVEPEEVENVLCRFPEIKHASVKPYTDEQGLSYMVAYLVPKTKPLSVESLRKQMANYLTPFMIPEFFVCLNTLPLTPNGKVDVEALPVVLKAGSL